MPAPNRCAVALSTTRNTAAACAEVLERVAAGLAGTPGDLAIVFASAHHADTLGELARSVRERGLGRHVLGCTAESVAGEGREVEGTAALALWSIALPGVELTPQRLGPDELTAPRPRRVPATTAAP